MPRPTVFLNSNFQQKLDLAPQIPPQNASKVFVNPQFLRKNGTNQPQPTPMILVNPLFLQQRTVGNGSKIEVHQQINQNATSPTRTIIRHQEPITTTLAVPFVQQRHKLVRNPTPLATGSQLRSRNVTAIVIPTAKVKQRYKIDRKVHSKLLTITDPIPSTSTAIVPRPIINNRHKLIRKVNVIASSSKLKPASPRKPTPTMIAAAKVKSRYKVDRTKQSKGVQLQSRSINKKVVLLNINGVTYRSSRTKLQRQMADSIKSLISNLPKFGSDRLVALPDRKFLIKQSGKALHRISRASSGLNTTYRPIKPNSTITSRRKLLKFKNVLKKTNIPCPIYRRLGKCLAFTRGRCDKLHDRNQVMICPSFLKGSCIKTDCLLSHNVCLAKMPVCRFYLQGCCTNETCPYLHKKLNDNAEICLEFLKGFCTLASNCTKRHEYVCPEWSQGKKCPRVKCPYPHGVDTRPQVKVVKEKPDKQSEVNKESDATKRYFDRMDSNSSSVRDGLSDEDRRKLDKMLSKVERLKEHHKALMEAERLTQVGSELMTDIFRKNSDAMLNLEQRHCDDDNNEDSIPRRPPIGDIPEFIPI